LAFNLVTYPKMLSGSPVWGAAAVALVCWTALFLGMVQVHLVPFLVHQDRPFATALKRSATLAVWKPFRSFLILLVQCLSVYGSLVIPPLAFLLPGVFAVLSNLSLLILLEEWRDPYEKTPEAVRAGA